MKSKYRFLAGGLLIAAVVLLLFGTSLRSSTVYYLTVEELISQEPPVDGQRVRVAGLVDNESVDWEPGSSTLRFNLIEGDGTLPVVYEGHVPDAFAQADSAVVEGELSPDGVFVADSLVVQCPSKYEARLTE
ncbi:MAG: cytochrome c maturation protein CcmE [Anaerolineae bacterium]